MSKRYMPAWLSPRASDVLPFTDQQVGGRLAGGYRWANLTPEERSAIAKKGAAVRDAKMSSARKSEIGRLGGTASMAALTPEERRAKASRAGRAGNLARWGSR